jgi:hypothetical protein
MNGTIISKLNFISSFEKEEKKKLVKKQQISELGKEKQVLQI